MPRAAIKTLGCKLNQYESEQLRERLQSLGYAIVDFDCVSDVYIVNSCTVTAKTDRDTRRLARRAKRRNPKALVVVTGCYAECSPQALSSMDEVDVVVGNAGKLAIPNALPSGDPLGVLSAQPADDLIDEFSGHTRCFVKVQEGCDAACTYCLIPRARGCSRSVPREVVVRQVRQLAARGYPEVVLIGTHLGQYGADLTSNGDLVSLTTELCDLSEVQRLRLSSIEPREVSAGLLELVGHGGRALAPSMSPGHGKLCRHLHIPVQSGCDTVLRRMGRPYDTELYRELVRDALAAEPQTCLGTDVIVGFPGETADEFERTLGFLESLPLAYLHVFSYSRRPGTPAAEMPDQVSPETKRDRNRTLRELSDRKRAAFARTMVGHSVEVVIQEGTPEGELKGLTDNYLVLTTSGPEGLLRRIVTCTVTDAEAGTLRGTLVAD